MSEPIRFWKTILSTQEVYHACLKLACEMGRVKPGTYMMDLTMDGNEGTVSFKVWVGDTPPRPDEMLRGKNVWTKDPE